MYLGRDGTTEVVGPGYKDARNFGVTLMDPFDLGGLRRGTDGRTRFWAREWEREATAGDGGEGKADRSRMGASESV